MPGNLQLFQLSLPRRQSSLIWPFANMETVKREWFSHRGHWLTPACVPLLWDWWSIWTALLHVCDIELAQVIEVLIFFQHGRISSMLCSFLPGTGTGNMIPGSNRFPGNRNIAASTTKESSSHKGWGACKTPAFSAFNIVKETIFIVLTLCEHANCEENGSLTVVTGWRLHGFPFFSTGDRYQMDFSLNSRSIGKTDKTLN